ncbi:MAG: hypothetical protein QM530_06235 [Phycisphaerales bacterium]|nr:hypothetical protein [Phycisphaerales bacterium]
MEKFQLQNSRKYTTKNFDYQYKVSTIDLQKAGCFWGRLFKITAIAKSGLKAKACLFKDRLSLFNRDISVKD